MDLRLTRGYSFNALPSEPSHFFFPRSEIQSQSLCEGVSIVSDKITPAYDVTCKTCKGQGVGQLAEEADVKLHGTEPDLSTEEYMTIFNRCVNEGEELGYHLPAVKDLTPEALIDHVNLLSKFSARIRIAKQAAKVTLEAKRIHLSKEQKEALRLRDLQYKPKPAPSPDKPTKARRASGTAKQEDAIETMMRLLGVTREVAEARLAKAKAKIEAAEESSN